MEQMKDEMGQTKLEVANLKHPLEDSKHEMSLIMLQKKDSP